ncbi:uncharacterized protein [Fopius arisanus]|uniref:Uncharacterized protein isoform X2 n=1 Tax=Fopius arisanus TaxID=64838 RepID=A0A9R1T149_9HYME|nr:PREDICTED: uncharacterized protein LOC105265291 isoform X2 [Fopius arisanus]
MENKNNKETINLLDLLSESESDLSDLVLTTPKKRRIKRRQRPGVRGKSKNSCTCNTARTRIITLWIAAVLITFWLITLSWLAAVLYREIGRMHVSIKSAIAGSEALPEALQKCHSASQKLEKNQTILFTQLTDVKGQIADFSLQLSDIQKGLRQVREQLKNTPELTNIPGELKDVKKSVATFGSSIRDLGATVNALKGTDTKMQEIQTSLLKNITDIQSTLITLSNITRRPEISTNETKLKTEELSQSLGQLKADLVSINEILTRNLTWVSNDQKKDHTLLVSLQDSTQNALSKVLSLQGECAKASEQSKVIESVEKLTSSLAEVQAINADLRGKLAQLEQGYSQLHNSTNDMLNKIATINSNSPNSNNEHSQISGSSTHATNSQSPN